jgi:hypothetical protein
MPKTPMDYSNCCIYKIEHIENENLVYVGHTTNFNKRKAQHKSDCINENRKAFHIKLYQMIRENGGFEMFKMIEVEKYPCNDKREALRREDEVMKELKADMNTYRAFLTQEEKKESHKEYYEENKRKIEKYEKEYSIKHKDEIKEYKKEWYETNKEKVKKKMNEKYDNNKDKLNEKMLCKCGCKVAKQYLIRHQATKKHIDIMN